MERNLGGFVQVYNDRETQAVSFSSERSLDFESFVKINSQLSRRGSHDQIAV